MAMLKLPCGSVVQLDEADVDLVLGYNWKLSANKRYAIHKASSNGRYYETILMHRLIMQPEPGMVIDHIDGNGLNNRRANLRICTNQQNSMNRRKTAGVFGRDGKWRAQIYFKGVGYSIGTFTDKDEAQRIRNWVARQLRGEFAPEVNDNTDYKPEMFPPRLRALLF